MNNPWLRLSLNAPYVAEEDRPFLSRLQNRFALEVLPDPFLGKLDAAKVVCLLRNPGYQSGDALLNSSINGYIQQNKNCILHKSDPPFYVLDARFAASGGYKWWRKRILNRIFKDSKMDELEAINRINRNLMCIQYFPYHSQKWRGAPHLPSQEYTFHLVREAINSKKKIILMRAKRDWLSGVKELHDNYVKVVNPANPALSPANLGENEYEDIKDRLLS